MKELDSIIYVRPCPKCGRVIDPGSDWGPTCAGAMKPDPEAEPKGVTAWLGKWFRKAK